MAPAGRSLRARRSRAPGRAPRRLPAKARDGRSPQRGRQSVRPAPGPEIARLLGGSLGPESAWFLSGSIGPEGVPGAARGRYCENLARSSSGRSEARRTGPLPNERRPVMLWVPALRGTPEGHPTPLAVTDSGRTRYAVQYLAGHPSTRIVLIEIRIRHGELQMATDVVMPQMGESIAEGTITKWLVKVGDTVERDQPLFEISTDKVDAEIPSPAAGKLLEIKHDEGETVEVDAVVAVIGEEGEEPTEAAEQAAPEPEPEEESADEDEPPAAAAEETEAEETEQAAEAEAGAAGRRRVAVGGRARAHLLEPGGPADRRGGGGESLGGRGHRRPRPGDQEGHPGLPGRPWRGQGSRGRRAGEGPGRQGSRPSGGGPPGGGHSRRRIADPRLLGPRLHRRARTSRSSR